MSGVLWPAVSDMQGKFTLSSPNSQESTFNDSSVPFQQES